jgi:hypothetical protein
VIETFVESFFKHTKHDQKILLRSLLIDPRVVGILPPSHTISTYTDSTNTSHQKYRRAMDQLSKLSHYKPLDNTAFHFYTPDKLNGIHRSQNSNNHTTAFNIHDAAYQSYLRYAHKIEDFIMGLQLTTDQ